MQQQIAGEESAIEFITFNSKEGNPILTINSI